MTPGGSRKARVRAAAARHFRDNDRVVGHEREVLTSTTRDLEAQTLANQ